MPISTILSLVGVGTASLIAVLHALRHRLPPGLLLTVALSSALAGGFLRDVILFRVPAAVSFWPYAASALVGMAVACWCHRRLDRLQLPVLTWFDAIGVGAFAVGGTAVALEHHVSILPACGLGVLTAIGGGIVRDVILGDAPSAFSHDPVVVASTLGAVATCVLWETGSLSVTSELIVIGGVAAFQGFATMPAPRLSHGPVLTDGLLLCSSSVDDATAQQLHGS